MDAKFRQPLEEDIGFILNSWLKTYRKSDECWRMIDAVYYRRYERLITDILKNSQILIACNPEAQDHIFGYAVHKNIDDIFVLHYIYVKQTYRQYGLARKMLQSLTDLSKPIVISFANRVMDFNHNLLLTYDPGMRK